MNIVFFGSSVFAVPALQAVAAAHTVCAVFTQPDRPKGRYLQMAVTPIKEQAVALSLPVCQPPRISDAQSIAWVRSFAPDVCVVVSYGQLFTRELLACPRLGCINVHASLLPRWRGAAPVNYALLSGDTHTGVTVMRMNERMDHGEIITQQAIPIAANEDAQALMLRLAPVGAAGLLAALDALEQGTATFQPQDQTLATYAPRLNKADGAIDWRRAAPQIHNQVRALNPWPCAHTRWRGMFIKVLKTNLRGCVSLSDAAPGILVGVCKHRGLTIAAANGGHIMLETVQPEGKRPMSAYDFVNGHQVQLGDCLG